MIHCSAPGHIPIRRAASTTILACVRSVKQKRERLRVFIERLQPEIGLDTKSLPDRNVAGNFHNGLRRFVPVKLRCIELQQVADCRDVLRRCVDENSHRFDFLRKLRANFCGFAFGNVARALHVKIEAQKICTSINGGESVGPICDPANFDADHGSLRTVRGWSKKSSQGSAWVRREHKTSADEEGVKSSRVEF